MYSFSALESWLLGRGAIISEILHQGRWAPPPSSGLLNSDRGRPPAKDCSKPLLSWESGPHFQCCFPWGNNWQSQKRKWWESMFYGVAAFCWSFVFREPASRSLELYSPACRAMETHLWKVLRILFLFWPASTAKDRLIMVCTLTSPLGQSKASWLHEARSTT